jgi:hypothetical protein
VSGAQRTPPRPRRSRCAPAPQPCPSRRTGSPLARSRTSPSPQSTANSKPRKGLGLRPPQDDVAPGQQRVARRRAEFGGQGLHPLGGQHGHRGVTVRRPPGEVVTDDAVTGAHLQPVDRVADLPGYPVPAPAGVAVHRETSSSLLDVVPVRVRRGRSREDERGRAGGIDVGQDLHQRPAWGGGPLGQRQSWLGMAAVVPASRVHDLEHDPPDTANEASDATKRKIPKSVHAEGWRMWHAVGVLVSGRASLGVPRQDPAGRTTAMDAPVGGCDHHPVEQPGRSSPTPDHTTAF